MNELNTVQTADPGRYFEILWRWRKFISVNVLAVTVIAVVVSLLLPKWYKARASVLPPKQELSSPMSAASSLLRGIGGVSRISGLGRQSGGYNFLAILKSRSTMEDVARKFDVIRVYGIEDGSMELGIEALRGNVSFELQDEDYITIDVLDRDPQRAADIANHFVDALNEISFRLATREARNNREFIEKRLAQNKADLRKAEDSWRAYQEKTGLLIIPSENSSSISAIAELYALKARKEIEMGILERSVSKDNPLLVQSKLELDEISSKTGMIPEASVAALRLYRDVVIQQKILELVVPMYEQATVDEQRDVPVILVLDKAVPPERKAAPRRTVIVLVSIFSSLLVSIVLVFVAEGIQQRSGRSLLDFDPRRLFRRSSSP